MCIRDRYYYDLHHRAPAWTGVIYLYQFLTENRGIGPYADEVPLEQVEPGDVIQLRLTGRRVFHHSPVVVSRGNPATLKMCIRDRDRGGLGACNAP